MAKRKVTDAKLASAVLAAARAYQGRDPRAMQAADKAVVRLGQRALTEREPKRRAKP